MSIPKNPETIVIENKFYPKGITEGQIYDYYQKVKTKLLSEVIGKNLTFYFAVDKNKIVVMRKAKTPTGFLRLNYTNYDTLISGRTISIHSNFGRTTDFGIIDIDIDNFELAKRSVINVYSEIKNNCPFITDVKIKYTGKESFHLLCYTKRRMPIDSFRFKMREFLLNSDLSRRYTIERKRISGIPNLDLSSNKYLGGYISLYSLSVWGLKSVIVDIKDIYGFKQRNAKI